MIHEYRLYTLYTDKERVDASLARLNSLGARGWGAARILEHSSFAHVILLQRSHKKEDSSILVEPFSPATWHEKK